MSTGELQSRCRPAQCTQIVPCQLQTRALWCGDHDLELIRLSSVFPATLDSQPLQMQKRISEMFAPLLAVVQQRDTEAQRLQTASERNEALNKQAADEQKAESKDCSWLLSPYFMLVSGLRPTLAWTIRQHPLAAPRVPRGCPPKAEREGFARISLFRHSLHPSLCSGPRPFFFSLSPSSLRCLFLFRSLTTSSSSCRLSRPHLCFSLSSIYVSVFALSISLSTHLCLLFRPLSLNVISLILIVSVAVCLSSLSSVCRPLFSLLSVSPLSLSLFSVAPSLASLLLFLTTFCLHPYLSFFLYLISRPLLLPSLYLYVLIYYVLPYFSFLLHLLAIFSSRGLSLSLPTSLKYHSSRKRPTCSRGYLRSPCSPTSLLLSMGM